MVLLSATAARAASSGSLTLPPSVPAPNDWAKPVLPLLQLPPAALKPTDQLDGNLFLPQNNLLSLATIPPLETSTPAQLEARLAAYVGTWRGESIWCSTAGSQVIHYPTELVYRFEQQNGRRVLACQITYTMNGAASVTHASLWVENGHIVSEVVQGNQRLRYVARTQQQNLVWRATDSVQAALDFTEIETFRLAVDGGQITTQGFEIEHHPGGDIFIHESSSLRLVK